MKKKIHLGKLEKLVILVMVVTLAVSILPQLDYAQLFAEDPAAVTLELKEGNITRPLAVTTTDTKAVEAVLLRDGAEVERKILNTNTPAQFDIVQNGTYVIQSIDVQGTLLEEHEQTVEGLADIYVEKAEQGGLTLYSRMENTDHIAVTFKEKKETVKVEKQANGLYQGSYTPKENGSYVFQSETVDNTSLGTTATYEETGIADQPKEEPKKEEPQEVKEIHITNEQGLKDIAKAPDKTYILDSDITVTSGSILVEKEFTGTLEGNGHVIKGLKQPLFSSLHKATIKNISLSSEISSNSDTAALAVSAKETNINGVGILASIKSSGNASGMVVNSNNSIIEHSYVSGDITGEAGASGFVVSGNAEISNSYVTGIVEGKQMAYGFGKDAAITNSYVAVYVKGKETGNFNAESKKLEGCFYDQSVASKEEPRAQEYTSAQMVSGNLSSKDFHQAKGSYPSLSKEITDKYSEEAKKHSALSTLAVNTETSLLGMTRDVALPSSTGKEEIRWSAEGNVGVSGNAAIAKVTSNLDQNTEGMLIAKTISGKRTLMAASAKLLVDGTPAAGESVAEASTSISFNMKANHYYFVTEDSDMVSKKPADHKAAIEGGWKRYLWNGAITWRDLKWNTTYYLYDYDLKNTKSINKTQIQTRKGKIGGSIQLSDNLAAGATLTATLKDTLTTQGTWKWEKAESPTSTTWAELTEHITTAENNQTSNYVLQANDSSTYIRATFTANDNSFEGEVQTCTTSVVKAPLTEIKIYTDTERTIEVTNDDMVVDVRLYAIVEPRNFDTEVDYTWHHFKEDGTLKETILGRGTSYILQGKDVGEKIGVKATAKGNGGASGIVQSTIFSKAVAAAPTAVPSALPILAVDKNTSIEDTSVTVKMPDSYTKGNGLYQFAYSQAGSGGVKTEFKVYARGSNPVTITGLKPRTKYYIYVKAVGENGHLASAYTETGLDVTTKNPFVKGTLDITSTGTGYRYGDTLNVEITGDDQNQTGDYTWYLVNDDGTRGEAVTNSAWDGYSITLDNPDYINHRLEVVLSGTGNYGGEISAQSEIIQLAECKVPSGVLTDLYSTTDDSVKVKLPKLTTSQGGERFNIGFSKLKNGVPEEYRPSGQHVQFASEDEAVINELDRNTTYYLFLRFDANKQHEKSDWSTKYLEIKTEKTEYNGAIYFEYGSAGSAPTQGERLVARLGKTDAAGTKPNSVDGVWSWYKTVDGVKTEIKDFYPGQDGYSTYYEIPKDENPGIVYTVEFKFHEDYKKKLETGAITDYVHADSQALLKYEMEKMTPADGDQLKEVENSATDSTITFLMDGTPGLVYGFRYSTGTDVTKAQAADYDAYAGTKVTIKGLSRNTDYNIWVQVKGNENYADSDWSSVYLTVTTKKTDILGYVEISGSDTAGQKLTAMYNNANYMPSGSDAEGKWQWYRENTANNSYELISGAITDEYTPSSTDIDKRIKAVYTISSASDFNGSKEAVTTKIKKRLSVNPALTELKQGTDTADSKPTITFTLEAFDGVWYRIQKSTDEAPQIPTQMKEEELKQAKWTKCTSLSIQSAKDADNEDLKANTNYTLYVVRPETGDTQVSSIISKSTNIGTVRQTGTILIKNMGDGKEITYPVIGKTIQAELINANNNQGTWKWYKSKSDCGVDGKIAAPSIDSVDWIQLAGGYSPTINSSSSTLTLSEDLWKHYIKVEFVPNNEIGYGGDSIEIMRNDYVRKIYEEQIKIESSTKDGNGGYAAYSGTKLTATVENWTKDALKGRFEMYINESNPTAHTDSNRTYSNNTMTSTESNWPEWDGKNIYAQLTVPSNIMLYVNEKFEAIAAGTTYKSDRIPYRSGIAISNEQDFVDFMKATGKYTGNDIHCILTKNLDMSASTYKIPLSALRGVTEGTEFNGRLDGDFHTVNYLQNSIFFAAYGISEENPAEIKNMILKNATVVNDGSAGNGSTGIVAVNFGSYVLANKLFLVESNLKSTWDTGFINGWTYGGGTQGGGNGTLISECGSAGGVSSGGTGSAGTVGGLSGNSRNGRITHSYSIGTDVVSTNNASGLSGSGVASYGYAANKVSGTRTVRAAGGLDKNTVFFNMDVTNATDGGATGKTTKQMAGNNLSSALGTSQWTYKEGFYPRLTWIANHPIANLYAATRGAFIPLKGTATTLDQLFNGEIYGAVEVPDDLKKNGYTYSSSDPSILKVTEGGTIIPVGAVNATAKITIRYDDAENGGYATNSYDFTVKKQVKALNTVSISGTTSPGQKLSVTSTGASTYQWYRRKSGETVREPITNANSSTYTIQPKDVGYEINVDVGASNYATMSSGYTRAVTSVKPTGIDIQEIKDNSVKIKAQGIDGADYEYAYATSEAGNKIIAGHSTEAFTITGLSRNSDYWLFARVAGGSGYEPSEWSTVKSVTTQKTDIIGPIKTNGEINMEREIRAYIGDDNLQKGNWKIERLHDDGNKEDITASASKKEQYDIYYTLTKADVGSRICFTYNGSGDFKDPDAAAVSYTTPKILKKAQAAPGEPTGEMKDAHTMSFHHTGSEIYDFGYTETAGKDIHILDNNGSGYAGNTSATVSGLKRNTMYYLYARLHEKEDFEPSGWSAYTTVTTDRSDITGNSTISFAGAPTVNQTITFTAEGTTDDTIGLTGIWVLERIDKDNNANTVLGTIDTANENRISYQLKPEDAGYRIRATYNANRDYKGVCMQTSDEIMNAEQAMETVTTSISNTGQYQTTLNVTSTTDNASIYEFGYRKHSDTAGDINSNHVTVTWGKDVEITSLSRNTEYDFFIRKAEKIGYNASAWQQINTQPIKTQKSPLLGNITVTSDTSKPSIDTVLTVEYVKGIYPDEADDTTSGSWQWYLDNLPISEMDGGTKPSFKIPPVDGNPTVKVRYTARNDSDFSEYTERSFGNVYKDDYQIPVAPTVTALGEDTAQIGSMLRLISNETPYKDIYYYLQSSDIDELPVLEISEEVDKKETSKVDNSDTDNTDHWIKVNNEQMDIRVDANKSYVVYVARLESRTHAASGINSARPVRTAKEPLERTDYKQIEEADSEVEWKTLQSKTVQYTVDGKAPTVSWKYYVASKKDGTDDWQNIDAEMKAVKNSREDGISADKKYAISRFEVPLKYTGQYLKITMTGIDDYSGMITLITKDPLEGALISGTARIETKDTTKVLDTLEAKYLGEDEKNGVFTWYRHAVDREDNLVGTAEKITDSDPGNVSGYALTPLELDHMVYAVYTAPASGQYVGSVQTNGIIVRKKAEQNKPNSPTKVRVNGNSIQFSTPSNYKTNKIVDIPYVQIGYLRYVNDQPVNDSDEVLTEGQIESNIHWQSEAEYKAQETWFHNLRRDSDYKLFARFIPTAAYDQSVISDPSETIKTEHALFDEKNLDIKSIVNMLQENARPSNIGSQIQITYTGDGYDEGEFLLHRSNGDDITVDSTKVVQDDTTNMISYTYTYTKEDVGSYITAEYRAKETARHYQGSIMKTDEVIVTKLQNPAQPEEQYRILKRDLDTNLILEKVNDRYEYYLSNDVSYAPKEGDWDTLSANDKGAYIFTNLDRNTEYYLWTRIAETDEFDPSTSVKSAGVSPEPFINFGTIEIMNSSDRQTPPWSESDFIPFPDTLKKGKITINNHKITRTKQTEGSADTETITAAINHPVSDFMKEDGSATDLIYEKGSTWGNDNFAVELIFYNGTAEVAKVDGTQTEVTVPEAVTHMKVRIYRVNAMSEPEYIWDAMMMDDSDEHITAKLKANITMITQVNMAMPQKIQLTLDDQVMKQSTNNEQAVNGNSMPLQFGIDRRVAEKSEKVPSLAGEMKSTDYYNQIPAGTAYLKCSNDGTNYTNITKGAWMDTELVDSAPAYLMKLGVDAWSGYYFSGITSKDQTWVWDLEANKVIDQAYRFNFLIEVSKEDARINKKYVFEVKSEEATK